jgi:uncharacterized protein DUF3108
VRFFCTLVRQQAIAMHGTATNTAGMGAWLHGSAIFFLLAAAVSAATWETSVTAGPPGPFPPPRPLVATYRFGWAGITAATGEAHFKRNAPDRFQLDGTAHTTGVARALWKMDVAQHAIADARSLRPIEMEQTENVRSKTIVTRLTFNAAGVTRTRIETKRGVTTSGTKQLNRPNLFDLHSALLYVRSQSLRQGTVHRIIVFPATSSYLATITVAGREKVSVPAGTFNAVRLDLQLNKIGKKGDLEPHRKFRRGTIWVSDDSDRILLRINAQIFVGTVFAELQSVQF